MGGVGGTLVALGPRFAARENRVRKFKGFGNLNSHGARPVHQIISIMQWIRTSGLSIKNPLSSGWHGTLVALGPRFAADPVLSAREKRIASDSRGGPPALRSSSNHFSTSR